MFVLDGMDAIVAFEDKSIDAAEKATAADGIPVVFLHPSDPLRDGLTESFSRPGGNPTGVFGPARCRREAAGGLPGSRAATPSSADARRPEGQEDRAGPGRVQAGAAAKTAGARHREATTAEDLERVFRSLRPGEVDGAFLLSNNLRQNHSALSVSSPGVRSYRSRGAARNGSSRERSSRTASISRRSTSRRVRRQHPEGSPGRPARGGDPELEFAINLAASRLGIKVPQEMIHRAESFPLGERDMEAPPWWVSASSIRALRVQASIYRAATVTVWLANWSALHTSARVSRRPVVAAGRTA